MFIESLLGASSCVSSGIWDEQKNVLWAHGEDKDVSE